MKKLSKVSLSILAGLTLASPAVLSSVTGQPYTPVATAQEAEPVKLYYGLDDPHGDNSFAYIVVAMQGDTIVDVYIDEFQFVEGDGWTGVPNSDKAFGENYPEGQTLISKRENDEQYSGMMTEVAQATQSYVENIEAIQNFAIGKTIAEVEAAADQIDDDDANVSDVVSGATLADTDDYLDSIVEVVTDDGFSVTGAGAENPEIKTLLATPNGDDALSLVSVVVDGDTIVAAQIDELQYNDEEAADWDSVPNGGEDDGLGANIPEDKDLISKLDNNEEYSALMKEYANATTSYKDSMQAISDFVAGKTFDEIQAAIDELEGQSDNTAISDVVSGATLASTPSYLSAILEAAQQ